MPLPANGKNVKLGKGAVMLAPYESNGAQGALEFMGNVTALNLSADVTKTQTFSSTQASAPLLDETATRTAYTLTATGTEFTLGNMQRFLLGELAVAQQTLNATASTVFTGVEVKRGGHLDLNKRRITNVVVTRDGSDVLAVGVDYVVYTEFGVIKLTDNGAVNDGDSIEVEYSQPALTLDRVRIAKKGAQAARLLFLADDANTGGNASKDRLDIWRVSILPDGDMGLIGDDYGAFNFTMAVLDDSANHPLDPFGNLERVRA